MLNFIEERENNLKKEIFEPDYTLNEKQRNPEKFIMGMVAYLYKHTHKQIHEKTDKTYFKNLFESYITVATSILIYTMKLKQINYQDFLVHLWDGLQDEEDRITGKGFDMDFVNERREVYQRIGELYFGKTEFTDKELRFIDLLWAISEETALDNSRYPCVENMILIYFLKADPGFWLYVPPGEEIEIMYGRATLTIDGDDFNFNTDNVNLRVWGYLIHIARVILSIDEEDIECEFRTKTEKMLMNLIAFAKVNYVDN